MDISKSSGYRDFVWAIELNRPSLELIGLWPKIDGISKRSIGPNIRVSFAFITITFFLIIPLVHALTRVWGNMVLMIDNLRFTLPFLTILLKLVIMRWKQSVLLSVINMMKEDWIALKLDVERNVMMKRMRTSRLIVICAYFVMVCTSIVITIFSCFGLSFRRLTNLTDRNRPLLLQTYYFYDTDKSPQFELTYLTQIITLFLGLIIYASVDTFLGLVIFHICGQLENFRGRLINLIAGKEFNKALSNNIVNHLRLIRYVDKLEDIYNLMMLGSVIYFGIIFCLCGFVFIVMIKSEEINVANLLQIYYMIAAIIVYFMQMFFYCYAGEIMIEQCEAVYHAVYDIEWYNWESKQARNLILLMIRVQQSFRITAGKMVPLTMTTFCSLLKTSASYISFLLAIQN
ncbi:odorant receptor 13a-like [Camponotus floridanus]|nr:odorant receptor 13a-like [Camponotus floridanus]